MELLFILEMIGTVAFAASGAMRGIEKQMDIFGIMVLGMTTAVGGGILRDLILGYTPPAAFRNPVYAMTAIGVSAFMFLPAVRNLLKRHAFSYDLSMLIMDTVGLGVFTVTGLRAAIAQNGSGHYFLLIFVAVVTGVGGGVLRDVMAGVTPYIFVKHFYACACICGAVVCLCLWNLLGGGVAMIGGAAVVMVLRFLAARYHWSLPKA